jgi:hypothetical protein
MKTLKPEGNVVLLGRAETHSVVKLSSHQITIRGKVCDTIYERTFCIGDTVEYDSDFYGSCYGQLQSINDDVVTVVDKNKEHKIPLYNFAKRNWDFDYIEAISKNF